MRVAEQRLLCPLGACARTQAQAQAHVCCPGSLTHVSVRVCVHAHVAVLTQTHSHCHGWDYRRSLSIVIDIS